LPILPKNKKTRTCTVRNIQTDPIKKSKKAKEKKKTTKWFSERDNQFTNSVPPFIGSELVNIDTNDGATPYSIFIQIFTDELFELIRVETIRYAVQCGKDNFTLSVKELKIFFAINIAMTYIKYPNVQMYWSSQDGLRMDLIADAMPYNRFTEIKRYINFADNSNQPNTVIDKYWKVRPVLDILHQSFHAATSTSERVAIDEMMVPFKGKSNLKQYLKSKPKKWGFKIWVQASTNGYVHCFEMYQGASNLKRTEYLIQLVILW